MLYESAPPSKNDDFEITCLLKSTEGATSAHLAATAVTCEFTMNTSIQNIYFVTSESIPALLKPYIFL